MSGACNRAETQPIPHVSARLRLRDGQIERLIRKVSKKLLITAVDDARAGIRWKRSAARGRVKILKRHDFCVEFSRN